MHPLLGAEHKSEINILLENLKYLFVAILNKIKKKNEQHSFSLQNNFISRR